MEHIVRNAILSHTSVPLIHCLFEMRQEEIQFRSVCEHIYTISLQCISNLCIVNCPSGGFPKEVVMALSLPVFKKILDNALSYMV